MTVSAKTRPKGASRGNTGKGISVSALAGVASLAAGVLLLPVVISTVGSAPYGTWLFLLASILFLFFLDFGIGIAVAHFIARSRSGDSESDPDRIASTAHAWALLASVAAIGIFLLVCRSYSAEALEHVSETEFSIVVICGVCILITMVLKPMTAVLFGAGFLHIERRNQIIGVAARIVGTLVMCFVTRSVAGVAVAETIALIVPALLSVATATRLRLVRISLHLISWHELQRMFSYSMRSFTVSMVGAGVLQLGTILIGTMGSASQVTYFNAAFRIYLSVRQVIGWITDPFRSVMSRLYVRDRRRAERVLYDLLFVSFVSSALGCIFLMVIMPGLLRVWLGDDIPISEVSLTAGILLSGLILNAIHIPLIPASDAAGSPGAFLPHQVFWLLSSAVLGVTLFPTMGIAGAALALTAPLPILELAYLLRAHSTVNLNFEFWFRRVIRPSIGVLILGVVAAAAASLVGANSWMILLIAFGYLLLSCALLIGTREKWGYQSIRESLRLEA